MTVLDIVDESENRLSQTVPQGRDDVGGEQLQLEEVLEYLQIPVSDGEFLKHVLDNAYFKQLQGLHLVMLVFRKKYLNQPLVFFLTSSYSLLHVLFGLLGQSLLHFLPSQLFFLVTRILFLLLDNLLEFLCQSFDHSDQFGTFDFVTPLAFYFFVLVDTVSLLELYQEFLVI